MLIRFLPAASHHPSIIFALSSPNHGLVNPPAWTNQIQQLIDDGLELPHDFHALDRGVGICSLLEEITFDAPNLLVSCRFQDGALEQWPFAEGCLQSLEKVLNDVSEASAIDREKAKPATEPAETAAPESKLSLSLNSIKNKHKKQRSLLMSIVASIVPMSSQHQEQKNAAAIQVQVPVETSPVALSTLPSLSPRALRRRARSTLVDTFRKFVLRELRSRMPKGGYYPWVIQSMLRRSSDRMAQLASSMPTFNNLSYGSADRRSFGHSISSSTTCITESENEFSDSDADSISLRTPSSQHFESSSLPIQLDPPYRESCMDPPLSEKSASSSPSNQLAEYAAFSALSSRLRQLLHLHYIRQAHSDNEIAHREAVLEIRSRRRAWLNRAFSQGVRCVGLGMPFKSSPLAQHVFNDEKIFSDSSAFNESYSEVDRDVEASSRLHMEHGSSTPYGLGPLDDVTNEVKGLPLLISPIAVGQSHLSKSKEPLLAKALTTKAGLHSSVLNSSSEFTLAMDLPLCDIVFPEDITASNILARPVIYRS